MYHRSHGSIQPVPTVASELRMAGRSCRQKLRTDGCWRDQQSAKAHCCSPERGSLSPGVLWSKHDGDVKQLAAWQSMVSGFTAACLGPIVTNPFDVIKVRLALNATRGFRNV